jgi:methyltransferase
MGVSVSAYLVLLAAVGAERIVELSISARHERRLAALGMARVPERSFPWMAALHAFVLAAAALEVVLLRRPFVPLVAAISGPAFVAAEAARWSVIRTLGDRWSVRVVAPASLGIASTGLYRFVRHPNYTAVFVLMAALPLLHTAWMTALVSAPLHALVLRRRVAVEEEALLADPRYRSAMGAKPRFLPRFKEFSAGSDAAGVAPGGGET